MEITHVRPAHFYPEAAITFLVEDAGAHYHVPLVLSPFAYSTYCGS
jgi:5-hydroxyisourate hydrolase